MGIYAINRSGIESYTGMIASVIFLVVTCLSWHISMEASLPSRPNIILIMTDDQDIELGSMQFMPKTLHLLKERGVTFDSGFVSTPICCPSRSSILTGLYAHNHHIFTNNHNCSGNEWRNNYEKNTFAVYLKNEADYTTAYFGKYLNEYTGSYVPPGWDYWMGLIRNSRFYNYTVNVNGKKIKHGSDYEKDYFTDLITNDTIAYIRRLHEKHYLKPYMIVLSFTAPHGPEDPAPQYSEWFQDIETHRTEAWNYAPNPDKQWLLQHTGRMEPVHVIFTDVLHRRRLQTLQSVDSSIHKLINELRDLGDLSNTFFIYTSDHGYHLGQFGLVKGKNMPYEFDIRVPFYIRGPGLPKNISIREPVMNIDIAPTILDIAGVRVPYHMDGRSLIELVQQYDVQKMKSKKEVLFEKNFLWRNTVLIERGKMAKLNLIRDRFMKQRGRLNKDVRMQKACAGPEFREPCRKGQQWKCVRDVSGKWKIFKCHVDLNLMKECDCLSPYVSKRRYRRTRKKNENYLEKITIRRTASVAKMDEEGETVRLDESLQKYWKEEFLRYVQQREVIKSGEWHQGIFDDGNNNIRTGRSIKTERRKVESLCTRYNISAVCKPKFSEDSTLWTIHKARVDGRIESLKRKLHLYKDMRRTLKKRRPSAVTGFSLPYDLSRCVCKETYAQLLRYFDAKFYTGSEMCIKWDGTTHSIDELDICDEDSENDDFWRRKGREIVQNSNHARFSPKKLIDDELHANCTVPQMNCFSHGADHWRTPPFWPELYGKFCFCQNSNNNTYWCLRTVNSTHNFLYCEFITEFISYYDLNSDPYQLHNIIWSVPLGVLEQLSKQLEFLRMCQGHGECEHYSSTTWHTQFSGDSIS